MKDEDTTTDGVAVTRHLMQPSIPHLVDPSRVKEAQVTVRWQQDGKMRSQEFVTYVRCVPT